MKKLLFVCLFASLVVSTISCSEEPKKEEVSLFSRSDIPADQIESSKKITTSTGVQYEVVDYHDKDGNKHTSYFDKDGKAVDSSAVEPYLPAPSPYGGELEHLLGTIPPENQDQLIECIVGLNDEVPSPQFPEQSGHFDRKTKKLLINGQPATQAQIDQLAKEQKKLLDDYEVAKKKKRKETLDALLADNPDLSIEEDIKTAYVEDGKFLVITLNLSKIKAFLEKNKALIRLIERKMEATTTSLETAMVATNIAPAFNDQGELIQGKGIGIYMTEPRCAYSIDGETDKNRRYSVLGESSCIDLHSTNVASIIRAVSPMSNIYCRSGSTLPTSYDLTQLNPPISLVSASFRFFTMETGYTTYDREWDDFVYDKSILAVVAAGNEGHNDGYVTPPSRGLNVLTVGNYNDRTSSMRFTSSWKDPSDTKNDKPEISAPGTSIDAGYQISYRDERLKKIIMTGTSQATPHVAGIIADLMTYFPTLRGKPHLQKALIIADAYYPISGEFDKTGWGGVDLSETLYGGNFWWWEGDNASFDKYAKEDVNGGNSTIDMDYYLEADKKTRVVLTWLNRGSWTFDHLKDPHPIGMDLDFSVYDSSGKKIGCANSYNNGFEVFEFVPSKSDTYRISIERYANRDKLSKLRMALAIGTKDFLDIDEFDEPVEY